MRNLEQDRAKFAHEVISEVKKENKEIQKKYSSYVKSSPVLILSNGLGATLAFYLSKMKLKKDTDYRFVKSELEKHRRKEKNAFEDKTERVAYAYLYYHISEWLAEKSNRNKGLTTKKDPLEFIREDADVFRFMQLTRETIALLNWIRRFSDAMLEKEEE